MTRSILVRCAALSAVLGIAACDLEVTNPNQPGTAEVLASPTDIESLLGNYYKRWHDGIYRTTGNVWGMAAVQSFENYSSLSNNCQGQRVGLPRAANDNTVGNSCEGEQKRVYFIESEVTRVASTILTRMAADGFTLGSTAQDARARAFAEFLRGLSLGYLALMYDSAAVVSPGMSSVDPGTLSGYGAVMDSAMVALQASIDYANLAVTGAYGFPLPPSWIASTTSFTKDEFIRLVRSYRARLRANVARTPAERTAVDWTAVIADAQAGFTTDHDNITSSTVGPFNSWVNQWYSYGTWHQMTPFVIGMADVSGSYAAWIAQPVSDRGSSGGFTMVTPDLRFPQGATRPAQQADFQVDFSPANGGCDAAATKCKRYFANRPTGNDDFSGFGWGWSNYNHVRFSSWRRKGDAGSATDGKFPFFTKAELDLLAAEGHVQRSNFAAAGALINKTRVANGGLPALTAFDATTPVPGGADCVPKVPVAPFNVIACGNLMEALKYEKRIETAYTHFAGWFLDSRGWGDLPQGTGLHWAPPYQDLQSRGRIGPEIYSTGGGTNPGSAPKGTYGW